jgi:RNA polymerase sigma factor (sigma-70 family)
MSDVRLAAVMGYLRAILAPGGAGGAADALLLGRYVAGRDEAAFAELVRRHGPLVWGVCRRALAQESDAEDAFQATFLVFVRKAPSISKRQSVRSWLYSVAVRVAARARARAGRRQTREKELGDVAGGEPIMWDDVLWEDLRPVLDEEVNRLPAHERLPVILCYLEGKTYAAAAEELGCPTGTVAARLARGRERLRRGLTRRGVSLASGALAAVLAREVVAAVPAALGEATIRAGALFATGQAAVGAVPAAAASLAEGVVRSMFWAKVRTWAAVGLAAVVVGGGAGLVTYRVFGAGPAEARADKKEDKDMIQGTWNLVSLELGGKQAPEEQVKAADASLAFDGEKVTLAGKGQKKEGIFRLDPDKSPKEIDLVFDDETIKAVYLLEGNALKVSRSQDPGARPAGLATKEGDTTALMVFKKTAD